MELYKNEIYIGISRLKKIMLKHLHMSKKSSTFAS